jgi:putative flippase GtrA
MSAWVQDLRTIAVHERLRELLRFMTVGVSNTVVTLLAYGALVTIGAPVVLASIAGFCLGALNGYRLNRAWTFRGAAGGIEVGARYVVVQAVGLALNTAGVWLVVDSAGLPRLAGEVVILPFVTVTTYLLSRRWVFRARSAA